MDLADPASAAAGTGTEQAGRASRQDSCRWAGSQEGAITGCRTERCRGRACRSEVLRGRRKQRAAEGTEAASDGRPVRTRTAAEAYWAADPADLDRPEVASAAGRVARRDPCRAPVGRAAKGRDRKTAAGAAVSPAAAVGSQEAAAAKDCAAARLASTAGARGQEADPGGPSATTARIPQETTGRRLLLEHESSSGTQGPAVAREQKALEAVTRQPRTETARREQQAARARRARVSPPDWKS